MALPLEWPEQEFVEAPMLQLGTWMVLPLPQDKDSAAQICNDKSLRLSQFAIPTGRSLLTLVIVPFFSKKTKWKDAKI